mmetsp:Transcript_16175/g.49478  ORF Transcript_16175/g.49478 Transcript_16175/m.49478 type:complete len:244 (-) Transcript_16175:1140-1871(-)
MLWAGCSVPKKLRAHARGASARLAAESTRDLAEAASGLRSVRKRSVPCVRAAVSISIPMAWSGSTRSTSRLRSLPVFCPRTRWMCPANSQPCITGRLTPWEVVTDMAKSSAVSFLYTCTSDPDAAWPGGAEPPTPSAAASASMVVVLLRLLKDLPRLKLLSPTPLEDDAGLGARVTSKARRLEGTKCLLALTTSRPERRMMTDCGGGAEGTTGGFLGPNHRGLRRPTTRHPRAHEATSAPSGR